jgi:multidrug/microcin transport system ATP-binding/permease protein
MVKITWRNIAFVVLVSIPNTFFSFSILYIINSIVSGRNLPFSDNLGPWFVLMVVLSFAANIFLRRKIISYAYNLIYESEIKIFQYLQRTSLEQLEKVGPERVYAVIEDVRMFVSFPSMISSTISAFISLLICITYYFILSVSSAFIVVVSILALAAFYTFMNRSSFVKVRHVRQLNDRFYKVIHYMLMGFKELKMSATKSANLLNKVLRPNRRTVKDLDITIANRYLTINLLSQHGLYLLLGIILFVLPMLNLLERSEVISFVIILLFIIGPITALIGMQNYYTKAYVANQRISSFLAELELIATSQVNGVPRQDYDHNLQELRFENITYEYSSRFGDSPFVLGPINLTIKKGETIFIIGGNGSGKSTFINCLTGLCSPTSGSIYLNNKKVGTDDQHYRDYISAIFTDNHLFSHNYENYTLKGNKEYKRLINIMKLDKVVTDDEEVSARRKLSKGQGKRMAMIFSLLENRPILVLDEWAADQDPYFRKYFYEKLLPQLKENGKTVIAVTHDDTYFKHADRIIKLDYGKIIKDLRVAERPLEMDMLWEL